MYEEIEAPLCNSKYRTGALLNTVRLGTHCLLKAYFAAVFKH